MSATRWAALGACAAAFSLVPVTEGRSSIRFQYEAQSTAAALQSITTWLERSGERGWMGADVADALDILRFAAEKSLAARQKAFRTGETLHLAQIPADQRREFVLFMVKGPDEHIYFYLSSVAEGYKRGFVTAPGLDDVRPLDPAAGERGFRDEVRYWEGVIAAR
jgi:hypothetical protein